MALSRRQFLAGAAGLAGAHLLAPVVGRAGRGLAWADVDPASADRPRLVVLFLMGGNDGLNTVIPMGDVAGASRYSVYRQVRPTIGLHADDVLPLDAYGDADHLMGLNPALPALHGLYRDGRVAVVQGVDYPEHNYSHFTSTEVWHSGEPGQRAKSGWLGRHLDRVGIAEGELRGLGIGNQLPLMLRGTRTQGTEVAWIPIDFADGEGPVAAAARSALRRFAEYPPAEPLRRLAGQRGAQAVALVERMQSAAGPDAAGEKSLEGALLTARTLLELDFGVEVVHVMQRSSYDTHAGQNAKHRSLLLSLDAGIEAFFAGTSGGVPIPGVAPMSQALAARTLVMVVSEFGRRIGENGGTGGGTDHGAAGPVFVIGPPAGQAAGVSLRPGLYGDHPLMGTTALPADNLAMTTDVRLLYQTVLQQWLGDPDPGYQGGILPGLLV